MSSVTPADVQFMRDIQNTMNGGTSLNYATNPNIQKSNNANIGFTPDNPSMHLDKMKNFMRIVEGIETPRSNDVSITKSYDGSNYEVIVDLDESGRFYVIKDSNRNIYNDKTFSVFESAIAVCRILNGNGKSEYMEEFISLDEEFHKEKNKAMDAKNDYTRSMKLSESRAANIFENKFKRHQENANTIYKDIKSLFSMI